jgi:hypothetical protein
MLFFHDLPRKPLEKHEKFHGSTRNFSWFSYYHRNQQYNRHENREIFHVLFTVLCEKITMNKFPYYREKFHGST